MTLNDYIYALVKKSWLIIGIGAVVGITTFLVVSKQPSNFEGVMTVSIMKLSSGNDDKFYTYDGYYTLLSNGLIIDMIASWFSSPNIVSQIFNQAKLTLKTNSAKQLSKLFLYTKPTSTSGVLIITVKTGSSSDTQKLLNSASDIIGAKITDFKNQTRLLNDFNFTFSDPLVLEQRPKPTLQAIALGIAATILVGLLVVIKDYLKP